MTTRDRLSGALAALLGLSYLLLAAFYVAMPADQQSNAAAGRFFEALARDPTPSIAKFGLVGAGALLALGVVPAVAGLVRPRAPTLVAWTTNLAYLGFGTVLVDCARFIAYQPGRARLFADGDQALRRAIVVSDPMLYLDANGWFGFVGVGAWLLTVSALAWRGRVLPRGLCLAGGVAALGFGLVGGGFTFHSDALFLLGAGLGGLVGAPLFYGWLGLLLWRGPRGTAVATGEVRPDPSDPRAILAASAPFGALPDDAREELVGRLRREQVPAGTTLLRQGEPGDRCYLLAAGQAEVWQARDAARDAALTDWAPDPKQHVLVARLGPGEVLGEMAVLLEEPRSATVWAATDLTVYSFDGATLRGVVAAWPELAGSLEEEMLLRRTTSALGTRSPLGALDPEALRWVARRLRLARFEAGEAIVRQGEPGDALFIVKSGRAEVLRSDAERERPIGTLKPGDAFGEQALVTGEPRAATVRALEPVEALALDREELRTVVRRFPDRARYFLQLTLQRQRPRPIAHAVLEQVDERDGRTTFVLKDAVAHRYMKLSERGAFLWTLMDGERSVRDLAQAYYARYRVIGVDDVLKLIVAMGQAGFVEVQRVDREWLASAAPSRLVRLLVALQPYLVRYVSLPDVDGAVSWLHRSLFRPFFTRAGQALLLLVAVAGAALYLPRLFGGGPPAPSGSAAALAVGGVLALTVQGLAHELAHALTTKQFGREVHRAGVGWYLFLPVGFVDTSDMWLAPRRQRATVSLAGPYTNLVLAGLATLLLPLAADPTAELFLLQLAATGYLLALVNLNPLLETDGYYVLMDALDVPNLRAHALAFVGALLWRRPTPAADPARARVFRLYGALTLGYTAFVATAVLSAYQRHVQEALARVLPDAVAASLGWGLAATLCGLILTSLWSGLRAGATASA